MPSPGQCGAIWWLDTLHVAIVVVQGNHGQRVRWHAVCPVTPAGLRKARSSTARRLAGSRTDPADRCRSVSRAKAPLSGVELQHRRWQRGILVDSTSSATGLLAQLRARTYPSLSAAFPSQGRALTVALAPLPADRDARTASIAAVAPEPAVQIRRETWIGTTSRHRRRRFHPSPRRGRQTHSRPHHRRHPAGRPQHHQASPHP